MRILSTLAVLALLPTLLNAQAFDPTGTWQCQGGIRAKTYTSGYEAVAQSAVMVVYANGTFEREGRNQTSAFTSTSYISGTWWFDGATFYTSGVHQNSHTGTSEWSDAIPVVSLTRMYKLQDLQSQVFLEQCDRR